VKRPGCADRLEAYFKAHKYTWVDGLELATIGGAYAWRTRLSDLRKRGMVIENEQRTYGLGGTRSFYRYVPPTPVEAEPSHDLNSWSLR
jgi:hypothetical protein